MLRFAPGEHALFFGTEQEGWHKGLRTLFVVNEPDPMLLLSSAMKHRVRQIYFGAGFLSQPSIEYISKVIDFYSHPDLENIMPAITLETQHLHMISRFGGLGAGPSCPVGFILTLFMENVAAPNLQELVSAIPRLRNTQIKFDFFGKTFVVPSDKFIQSEYLDYKTDCLIYRSEPQPKDHK